MSTNSWVDSESIWITLVLKHCLLVTMPHSETSDDRWIAARPFVIEYGTVHEVHSNAARVITNWRNMRHNSCTKTGMNCKSSTMSLFSYPQWETTPITLESQPITALLSIICHTWRIHSPMEAWRKSTQQQLTLSVLCGMIHPNLLLTLPPPRVLLFWGCS